MSAGISSPTSNTAAIQVGGVDVVQLDSTGITSGIATAVAAYFNPINNTGAVSDLVILPGQTAFTDFVNATLMPLNIACGDGQIYELNLVGTYTPAAYSFVPLLLINNVTLAGNFNVWWKYTYATANTNGGANSVNASTGFYISQHGPVDVANLTITTSTANKTLSGITTGYTTTYQRMSSTTIQQSLDTTTAWNSFGTISMPQPWTGRATLRRTA